MEGIRMGSRHYLVLAMIGLGASAQAASLTFNFTELVSGGQPTGSGAIATLSIMDAGVDEVDLTLTHNVSSAFGQYISGLWLNIDPVIGNVFLSNPSPAAKFSGSWQFAMNNQLEAGLRFDGYQAFDTSSLNGGANRLRPGESVSFRLTGPWLDAADFLSTAVPTNGGPPNVVAMIQVQGIGPGDGSGHMAAVVPEPVTLVSLGAGLALIARRRRKLIGR